MENSKKLDIKSLGRFEIYFGNEDIMSNLSSKAAGLLCFLSMCPDMTASKDMLSSLFWNDDNGESARYNLRFTTWQIKRLFNEKYDIENIIVSGKNNIKIIPEVQVESDALKVKEYYRKAQISPEPIPKYEEIKKLYFGDFLENFEFKNCFKFNDWIFYEKEDLQRMYFSSLNHLASYYMDSNKKHAAIDIYREMLRINPFIEETHVMLMRAYISIGDRNSALTQYERCCSILRDELNVAPMDSTKKAYSEIISGGELDENDVSDKTVKDISLSKKQYIKYSDCNKFSAAFEKRGRNGLMTACLEESIDYYWIWNLVEEILDNIDKKILGSISEKYWQAASLYNNRINEELGISFDMEAATKPEIIKTFSSLFSILKLISKNMPLEIFVDNSKYMDSASKKFYQMLLKNITKTNIIVHELSK